MGMQPKENDLGKPMDEPEATITDDGEIDILAVATQAAYEYYFIFSAFPTRIGVHWENGDLGRIRATFEEPMEGDSSFISSGWAVQPGNSTERVLKSRGTIYPKGEVKKYQARFVVIFDRDIGPDEVWLSNPDRSGWISNLQLTGIIANAQRRQ